MTVRDRQNLSVVGTSLQPSNELIESVLLNFGDEQQRERWIPKLINADLLGCFAITEANTGSDVASMKSTAVETEGGFTGNGTKMWDLGGACGRPRYRLCVYR